MSTDDIAVGPYDNNLNKTSVHPVVPLVPSPVQPTQGLIKMTEIPSK
jgi:hypothetical protein